MTLDRILIGDDEIESVKEMFPSMPKIPTAEIDFVSTPEELIEKAKTGNYTHIIIDLNFTPNGQEGYEVLDKIKGIKASKILLADKAEKSVKEKSNELGAGILNKDAFARYVAPYIIKASFGEGDKIMFYTPARFGSSPWMELYKEVLEEIGINPADVNFVDENLLGELSTGKYGLCMDCSGLWGGSVVAHDLQHLLRRAPLPKVPKVINFQELIERYDKKSDTLDNFLLCNGMRIKGIIEDSIINYYKFS